VIIRVRVLVMTTLKHYNVLAILRMEQIALL